MIKNPDVEKERSIASKWHKTHRAKDKYDAEPGTGTVDDQDEPEDERDNENEAPVGAPSDHTEAPEEFKDE